MSDIGTWCGVGLPGGPTLDRLPEGPAWQALWDDAVDDRAVALLAAIVTDANVLGTERQFAQLDSGHESAMRACVQLERSTLVVAERMTSAGIPFRILKGPAVAHLDYPDPSWRAFGDVDILVPSADYDRAVGTISELGGYRRSAEIRPGFDRRFGKGTCLTLVDGTQIDVHRTFAPGPFGFTIDAESVFTSDPDVVTLAGVRIPVLTRVQRLVHAWVHAALGDATPRVVTQRDIAQIMLTTDVDIDAALALAERWHLGAVAARAVSGTWERLRLAPTATSRMVVRHTPGRFEARALAAYDGPRRSYARQMVAAVPAIPGLGAKAAYLRALVFVDRDYARRHDGGYLGRVRRAWDARARRWSSVR